MNKYRRLSEICDKYDIGLVYLFGSQKEKALEILEEKEVSIDDPLADIDIGLVFIEDIDKIPQRYKLYSEIYNEIEDLFKPYPLDLIFLQEHHSIFQLEAIEGICIYYISEDFKDNYELMVLRRAADFKYDLDKFTQEVLEKY